MTGRTLTDKEYWEETGRIVKEYFKLKLGPGPKIRFLEAWKSFLIYAEKNDLEYTNTDDPGRGAIVDRFFRDMWG